jgi:collagenase-like PrtC family protease
MKFSIGYQFQDENEDSFASIVYDYPKDIEEVYFPWVDNKTCRSSLVNTRGYINWNGQQQLEHDIRYIKNKNIKLNLLFNANCYGEKAVSNNFKNNICSIIEHIGSVAGGLDTVTTTSLSVAHIVKKYFKDIELRASVNMRIGSIEGMKYIAHLFDSYYIQRDYNRDLNVIKELKSWADSNGKKLCILANSGCMRLCSGQIFHDNLVAHEAQAGELDNMEDFNPHACWNYYKDRANWVSILQNTWIRPEDIHHYKDYFSVVKLATRASSNPRRIIKAYIDGIYRGNLLDLLEPGFGKLLRPWYIDNEKFPDDWAGHVMNCDKKCHQCNYCKSVLDRALIEGYY